MIRKAVIAILALGLAACASLPPECKTEYAHTILHCRPPSSRPPANAAECKQAGGVPASENGRYRWCLSRDELRDLMNVLAGPRGY